MELYVVIYFVTSCIQDNEQRLLYSFNRAGYMDRSVLGVELILQTNKLSMSTKMICRPVLLFLSNFNERRSSNSFLILVHTMRLAQCRYTKKNHSILFQHHSLLLFGIAIMTSHFSKKVLSDGKKIIGMHCIPLMLYRLNYELAIFESIYNCKFNVGCHVMHCKPHSLYN